MTDDRDDRDGSRKHIKAYRENEAAEARRLAQETVERSQRSRARVSDEFSVQLEEARRARDVDALALASESLEKSWDKAAQEVTQRREDRDDGPNGQGGPDEPDGPHRPDPQKNSRDQHYARQVADHERVQRESVANQERSDKRDEHLREHHPEEARAEEVRRENQSQDREASPYGVYRPEFEHEVRAVLQQREGAREESSERFKAISHPERSAEAETARETNDRGLEKRDKDQRVEARSQGMREWYLEKRKQDRENERDGNGGGRER